MAAETLAPLDLSSQAVGEALRSRLEYWAGLIRTGRKRHRLSRRELAQRVGTLSQSTLECLEKGTPYTNPDPRDILALALALDIPPDILGIVEPRSPLAKLVTLLAGRPPEVAEHLYALLSYDGPLLRDRRTAPTPCQATQP